MKKPTAWNVGCQCLSDAQHRISKSEEKPGRSDLAEFLEGSSIHGLKYLGQAQR